MQAERQSQRPEAHPAAPPGRRDSSSHLTSIYDIAARGRRLALLAPPSPLWAAASGARGTTAHIPSLMAPAVATTTRDVTWTVHVIFRPSAVAWELSLPRLAWALPLLLFTVGLSGGLGWRSWVGDHRQRSSLGVIGPKVITTPGIIGSRQQRWPRRRSTVVPAIELGTAQAPAAMLPATPAPSEPLEAAMLRAKSLGLGTYSVAGRLLAGIVAPEWIEAAGGSAATPGTLRWPVNEGWFVRGWGSGEGGYHLAVDIMGELGVPVRAAAEGMVGYAGNRVRGYGNLIVLVHQGGWVTTYAHNAKNLVVAGQLVRAGEQIAELGSTGISRGPHVHFEFIVRGRNCDPGPLFRPMVRHRDGHGSIGRQVSWADESRSPREVQCDRRRRHPRSQWYDRTGNDSEPSLVDL